MAKNPPATYQELVERHWEYVRMEELDNAKCDLGHDQTQKHEKETVASYAAPKKFTKDRKEGKEVRIRKPKYEEYTELNASRGKIFHMAAAEFKDVKRPPPIRDTGRLDRSKFCKFHNSHGHNTNDCIQLRDVIESLIRQGKLQEFIQRTFEHIQRSEGGRRSRSRSRSRSPRSKPSSSRKTRPQERSPKKRSKSRSPQRRGSNYPKTNRVINTIIGGFGGGGDSMRARKRHLREVNAALTYSQRGLKRDPLLCFTEEDLRDVIPGHEDALVISGGLVNTEVRRLLVDNGSSSDILFIQAFDKLGLKRNDLRLCFSDLIGFSGEENTPLVICRPPPDPGEQRSISY